MRILRRNARIFWYCPYEGREELTDEYGNATGDFPPRYGAPAEACGNISPATGQSGTEQFGNLTDYDKVIVGEGECPFDESAVLFIDKDPDTDLEGHPQYDYIVRRVAQSLNSWSAAVRKVTVS